MKKKGRGPFGPHPLSLCHCFECGSRAQVVAGLELLTRQLFSREHHVLWRVGTIDAHTGLCVEAQRLSNNDALVGVYFGSNKCRHNISFRVVDMFNVGQSCTRLNRFD